MSALDILFYTIGALFFVTVIIALLIGVTARYIDLEKMFTLDRKTIIPRGPIRTHAVEGIEIAVDRRKAKKKKSKSKKSRPSPARASWTGDIESADDEVHYDRRDDPLTAGSEHAPKYEEKAKKIADEIDALPSSPEAKEFEEELEMAAPPGEEDDEILEESVGEEIAGLVADKAEEEEFSGYSRDLAFMLPENMCLDTAFRLKISLIRDEKFDDQLTIKTVTVDKETAKYFSEDVEKLGEKITEATTRIYGLEKGPLTVRPIAVGHAAQLTPSQRTVYFHPELELIDIEFYITPTKWSKELKSKLKIEFEQNYRVFRVYEIPIKIYKRKMEAIFGINISKWQTIVLFIYSAFGTISGLLSFFWDDVVPFFANLFGTS